MQVYLLKYLKSMPSAKFHLNSISVGKIYVLTRQTVNTFNVTVDFGQVIDWLYLSTTILGCLYKFYVNLSVKFPLKSSHVAKQLTFALICFDDIFKVNSRGLWLLVLQFSTLSK